MRTFKQIKQDFRFLPEHEQWLRDMRELMGDSADEVMNTLNAWIMGNKETARFFSGASNRSHVFDSQRRWFLELFSGVYDQSFYEKLVRIGRTHVRYKVEPHFMSRAVNIMRNTCIGILSRTDDSKEIMTNRIIALSKILDISLDVINTTYYEEELRSSSPVYKVRSRMIDFSEKFAQSLNLTLVLALIGLSLGVAWLFASDLIRLFGGAVHSGEGIISALGSLLMLWVMIELMDTEIAHLKGGKTRISVFVGVALVSIIRELMIAALRHDQPATVYYLIAAILVTGVVYWLVAGTETSPR